MSERFLEILAMARATDDPGLITDWIPYTRFLGIRASLMPDRATGPTSNESASGQVLTSMSFAPQLIGNKHLPALHGGALGALLESTALFQLLWRHDSAVLPKCINITVEYLRSGKAEDTFARARVTRLGRRIAHVSAEAWQRETDRPIAAGYVNFLMVPVARPATEEAPSLAAGAGDGQDPPP